MRLFRRADRPAVPPLPLVLPRRDGSSWPELPGATSFEAATYLEMGTRRAHEPEVHALTDRLVDAVLPRVDTGATAEDAPHLRKVLRTAALIGAGLGRVELDSTPAEPGLIDAGIARALAAARLGLPAMQQDWAVLAGWFLLAGHYLARQPQDDVPDALIDLVSEVAGR